jgi:hypothetical protein
MSVKFTANIEEDISDGGWLIRLTDTLDNTEKICKSLEEFESNINKMGDDYGGDVEVIWNKNKDVTDIHFKEIHDGMAKYKQEEVTDEEVGLNE